MAKFGRNPFPRRFGGGRRTLELEHEALLDALAPGWDTSEGTALHAEAYAEALAVSMIWAVNNRLRNQEVPAKMLEVLPTWEQACRLRPSPRATVQARRRAVAAKLRGLVGNTLADIEASCIALLGSSFVAITTIGEGNATTYWPGINPGPPGFEWSSNRSTITVHMKKDRLTEVQFRELRAQVISMLDGLVPDWMTFRVGVGVGTGSSFIVNRGIVGQTII